MNNSFSLPLLYSLPATRDRGLSTGALTQKTYLLRYAYDMAIRHDDGDDDANLPRRLIFELYLLFHTNQKPAEEVGFFVWYAKGESLA